MAASETMVRMGELAVSSVPGHVLVSLGLGSCIGLALLDRKMGIAGLAHIVLPQSQGPSGDSRKFADFAVPELVSELEAEGARKVRLEAVLVGGASMFAAIGGSMEVGARNEAAVKAQLSAVRIRVHASATGGSRGRTVRVDPKTGIVLVREAGGKDTQLFPATATKLSRTLQEVA
jgi:chemotaxis protein CheD